MISEEASFSFSSRYFPLCCHALGDAYGEQRLAQEEEITYM